MIKFKLNGKEIIASKDETIWQAAKRNNVDIPHFAMLTKLGMILMEIVEPVSFKLMMKEL